MSEPLDVLVGLERDYQPSTSVAERIGNKHLIAFIGAFAVGKTTLIESIDAQSPDYAEVVSFTTRPYRGDGDRYRFLDYTQKNLEVLVGLAQEGELVNFTVHPTTGHVYGTEVADYTARNCMLATTVKSYKSDRNLPFASVRPVVVVAEPALWLSRVATRTITASERTARIDEARQSLEWSLDTHAALFINNSSPNIQDTANRLVDMLEADSMSDHAVRVIARSMLRAAEEWR